VRQISLFPALVPDEQEPPPAPEPPPAEPEPTAWPEAPDILPGQLHLFSDRAVRLGRARIALAEARLDDARVELAELKRRFPDDPFLTREAARAAKLSRRLTAALVSPPGERPAALLAFARSIDAAPTRGEPWPSLRRALLRRVAGELEGRGDEALLEGEPPGFYLLEAGAFKDAREQLARAVVVRPAAHTLFLLGDAAHLAGAPLEARRAYYAALLVDPFDRALGAVCDDHVRALPDVARDEIGIEDAPAAWSAPVGVVTGVLPWPSGLSRELLEAAPTAARTAPEQRAMEQARAFVEALVESASPRGRGPGAIEVRRTMKRTSPELFAAYMERVVRGAR
jgi:hypothetical protein